MRRGERALERRQHEPSEFRQLRMPAFAPEQRVAEFFLQLLDRAG